MKAISYIRWSSDDQTAGNSLERQSSNAKAYCERNSLELVETLTDDGYSAFKGDHIAKGALGRFLLKADKGKFKGCALIVEQMDRLSRQGIDETWMLVRRLLKAGLEIHITQANRVVRSLDDLPTVILQAVESYAAEEYSRKLRERVSSAWRAKKHNGANGLAITRKLPGWLEGETGEVIRVNEEKAQVVRQIFELTAAGFGKRLVARRLNEQKTPTFNSGKRRAARWIASYVGKILSNRAVLGEYQPFKRQGRGRVPDGDARIDFYPAIIDAALFKKAQEAMAFRRTAKVAGRAGKIHNLFSGIVFDVTNKRDTRAMHYSDKGKRHVPKLATEKIGEEQPHTIDYAEFEDSFLNFLDQLDWHEVLDITESDDLRNTEQAVANITLDIERNEQQLQKITDLLIDTPSKALKERLLLTEAQIEQQKLALADAERRLDELKRKHHDLLDESVVFTQLAQTKDIETRARLRAEIRRKVERIDVTFGTMFTGDVAPDQKVAIIHFTNGAMRMVLFAGDKLIVGILTPKDGKKIGIR